MRHTLETNEKNGTVLKFLNDKSNASEFQLIQWILHYLTHVCIQIDMGSPGVKGMDGFSLNWGQTKLLTSHSNLIILTA